MQVVDFCDVQFTKTPEILRGMVLSVEKSERLTQGDWTISQPPTGSFDFAEVYGADLRDERLMPNDVRSPMITFIVADLVTAREEVAAAGIEILGETVWSAEAGREGHVYGIQQNRD